MSLDQLREEYEQATYRLANSHRELGQLLSAEKSAKVLSYGRSMAKTLGERENEGAINALNITEDIFKVRAEIEATKARLDYLGVAIQMALQTRE